MYQSMKYCVAYLLISLAALLLLSVPSNAEGWENPREVYTGWDCGNMEYDNATYDLCKQCSASGGTFYWNVPPGVTMLDSKATLYEGRCDEADSADSSDDNGSDDATETETDNGSSSSGGTYGDTCGDGLLRCPDGQCYAVESVNSCCAWGGACSQGNICWSMPTGSLCCKLSEKPTNEGCQDPNTSRRVFREPGYSQNPTETVRSSQGGTAPSNQAEQPKKPSSPYFNLTVCNKSSVRLWLAMGYRLNKGDQLWTFDGWWRFDPGQCRSGWRFLKGYTYFHGYSSSGKWGNDARFCVRSKNFHYLRDGKGKCSERSELFTERLVEKDEYTYSFTD
ncbi:MAG: hypothetical protein BGO03_04610 [Mesorhizobium sp. 61-13]|nr:MAG: hypothetical protein BGO03_04610 [Mesorhizobium sp. 61-13]